MQVSDLDEGAWELSYPAADGSPVVLAFGTVATGIVLSKPADIALPALTVGDQPRPGEDGLAYGRDFYESGSLLTFDLGVDTVDDPTDRHAANLGRVGALRAAWRADSVRTTPGGYAMLRTRTAGRTRVFFGRPRRMAPTNAKLVRQGYTSVIADFQCVDDLVYDDLLRQVDVRLAAPSSGGLLAPLASPLSTVAASAGLPGAFTIGGTAPAWVAVTVHGPVSEPEVRIAGQWSTKLLTTLFYDTTVTVDPQPWSRQASTGTGASVAGTLSRDSRRLSAMRLPPGTYQLVLSGTDATGTARASVSWRDCWTWL